MVNYTLFNGGKERSKVKVKGTSQAMIHALTRSSGGDGAFSEVIAALNDDSYNLESMSHSKSP
jgi:hypothetical protein